MAGMGGDNGMASTRGGGGITRVCAVAFHGGGGHRGTALASNNNSKAKTMAIAGMAWLSAMNNGMAAAWRWRRAVGHQMPWRGSAVERSNGEQMAQRMCAMAQASGCMRNGESALAAG